MKKILCIAALTLLTASCHRYSITFNDATVYQPTALFSDYLVTDEALSKCLSQSIVDQKIYSAKELRVLRCSHGGISAVDGLSRFTHLAVLNLSNNQLTNIVEIGQLKHLSHLDLTGNRQLNCANTKQLSNKVSQLILPKHCNN